MDLGNIFTAKFQVFWQAEISSRLIATIEEIRLITNIKDKIFCSNLASILYTLRGKKIYGPTPVGFLKYLKIRDFSDLIYCVFEITQNSGLF